MHPALGRYFADVSSQAAFLDPLPANAGAHPFFERIGFQCIERRRFGVDDGFVDRLDRARTFMTKFSERFRLGARALRGGHAQRYRGQKALPVRCAGKSAHN